MRKYLYSENGFTEKAEWQPNCWVNVECPDNDDFKFLTEELKVPESFLEDIADVDERPRTETEDNCLRMRSGGMRRRGQFCTGRISGYGTGETSSGRYAAAWGE